LVVTSPSHTARDERDAAVAAALAHAYRAGDVGGIDALRIIRHEMRRRNTNNKMAIRPRSSAAHAVIERYAAKGEQVPKNSSDDALHADHVHRLGVAHLERLKTAADWLATLPELRKVVCVTARENYQLEALEKQGITGPEKYRIAGIEWALGIEPSVSEPASAEAL
jgi:hypothetical protein